jgi:D-beta-D-heptose 7-phosphate kinase/D-beta-D-heptose 1-phosphate adenosyltransferase
VKPLVVVGDALLDTDLEGRVERICPDAPVPVLDQSEATSRPGGAALAAGLAAAGGGEVVLVTALAADEGGSRLAGMLEQAGVEVVDLGLEGPTPEKVRVRCQGQSLLRLDRGGPPAPPGPLTSKGARALADSSAVLVSDYGRGMAEAPGLWPLLASIPRHRPLVWDPHPRGSVPPAGALATPSHVEALLLAGMSQPPQPDLLALTTSAARTLSRRWRAAGVAVTLGAEGALLVAGDGPPMVAPASPIPGSDHCGAGDCFAAALTWSLAAGALLQDAVARAVSEASAFVAAGGARQALGAKAGLSARSRRSALDMAKEVRDRGGRVVAAGGCFDLLHPGHVATLQAARSLGDCLVVCLNSDESVARIKGPGRPLVPAADRAAVLAALTCVDAVEIFDESTPAALLRRLRPHVFAKGGDYGGATPLPEAEVVAAWGGQVVVLPYLSDRSTTGLLRRVGAGASTMRKE